MMDRWKRAWREAVENFRRELEGARAPLGRAAGPAERALLDARNELERVADELARARHRLEEERASEQTCRRREGLAREIGDAETAAIAADFAARHAERAGIMDRKVGALEDELRLRRADVDALEAALEAAEHAATGTDPDDLRESFDGLEREARERDARTRIDELRRRPR